MRWPIKLRLRLRSLLRRSRVDDELSRELQLHLDQQVEENLASGMSKADAYHAARRALGNLTSIREHCRDQRGLNLLDDAKQDVKYGARMLARNPGFAAAAIVTLALGIGATAGVFSVIRAVLFKPLPGPGSDRLVQIVENVPAAESFRGVAMRTSAMNVEEFDWWRAQTTTLDMAVSMPETRTLATSDGAERLSGALVSASWFRVRDVRPLLGRTLRADDERPDADAIVLSSSSWRRYFGSDPNVVGRSLVLDGTAYSIVGVMPSELGENIAFWRPFFMQPSKPGATTFVAVTSRLRDSVSLEAARAEIDVLGHRLRSIPSDGESPPRFDVVRVSDQMVARVRPALNILTAAVGLVLVIVCANVANLLLARGTARRRELDIRRALGAGRGRIVRQVLAESALLSGAGAVAGTFIAFAGVELVKPLAVYGLPERFRSALGSAVMDASVLPRIDEVAIDAAVLAFVVAIAGLAAILFGIAPALALAAPLPRRRRGGGAPSRADGAIGGHADNDNGSRGWIRIGQSLAIGQLTLATALLVATGLLVHSFLRLASVDMRFDTRVLAFDVVIPRNYPAAEKVTLARRVTEGLRSMPSVTAAGFIDRPPLSRVGPSWQGPVVPVGTEWRGMDPADRSMIRQVSPDYLRALGVPLIAGVWLDHPGRGPQAMLVNRSYVRRFFGDRSPIGATLQWGTVGSFQVVGVVEDMWLHLPSSPDERPGAAVFMQPRRGDDDDPAPSFAIRVAGDPRTVVPDVRRMLREIDPALAVDGLTTMEEVRAGLQRRPQFYAVLMTIFGLLAGVIAAIGVYGVLSYGVTRRTREIGIRIALGARRREVLGLVLRQAGALVAAGIGLGLLGAAGLTRYLSAMLFGITPVDVPTYAAVGAVFAAVAIVASYIPARRASRVDPVVALRFE